METWEDSPFESIPCCRTPHVDQLIPRRHRFNTNLLMKRPGITDKKNECYVKF